MGSWRGQLRSKYIVHLYKALRKLGKYFIKSKKKLKFYYLLDI